MSYDEGNRFFLYDALAGLCIIFAIASSATAGYSNALAAGIAAVALVTLRPMVVKSGDPHGHH